MKEQFSHDEQKVINRFLKSVSLSMPGFRKVRRFEDVEVFEAEIGRSMQRNEEVNALVKKYSKEPGFERWDATANAVPGAVATILGYRIVSDFVKGPEAEFRKFLGLLEIVLKAIGSA